MSYEETYGYDYEPTSEEFYADQAPADWANEEKPASKDVREETRNWW